MYFLNTIHRKLHLHTSNVTCQRNLVSDTHISMNFKDESNSRFVRSSKKIHRPQRKLWCVLFSKSIFRCVFFLQIDDTSARLSRDARCWYTSSLEITHSSMSLFSYVDCFFVLFRFSISIWQNSTWRQCFPLMNLNIYVKTGRTSWPHLLSK